MYKWQVRKEDKTASEALRRASGLSALVCDVLCARGIKTVAQANDFYGGGGLSDPFLIKDMDKAAEIIHEALANGDKITVYGDYDCDGVTSTVILYSYLDAVGGEVEWFIPTREEGYGLNIPAIERIISGGTKLIITVDNGVSARAEADYIRENGVSLVITDHHHVPEILPVADAVVNPHRPDDTSPYKDLAGVGVTLKLISALENGDTASVLEQYADFAAIGTVADIVPLTGENRLIVSRGVDGILNSENAGLNALLRISGIDENRLSASALAFTVCPRINAAGRYKSASAAVDLFLCEEYAVASAKAEELDLLNKQRRDTESAIMAEIEKLLDESPSLLNERVLVFVGDGWHHGVIGIVAARVLDRFGKPAIIIGKENGVGRASARGVPGFSLYNLLENSADLLIKFGGHERAAGFSINEENIPPFLERVSRFSELNFPEMPAMPLVADKELSASEITVESIETLSSLEPYGEANDEPLFKLSECRILSKRALKNGRFTSFNFDFQGKQLKALCFGIEFKDFWHNIGDLVDLIAVLSINEYNGSTSIVAKVKDIRSAGFNQDRFFAAKATYEGIMRGENFDPRLIVRIVPDRENLKKIYDLIRKCGGSFRVLEDMAGAENINYCMLRMGADALCELGLVRQNYPKGIIELNPNAKKVDLGTSKILASLAEKAKGGNR